MHACVDLVDGLEGVEGQVQHGQRAGVKQNAPLAEHESDDQNKHLADTTSTRTNQHGRQIFNADDDVVVELEHGDDALPVPRLRACMRRRGRNVTSGPDRSACICRCH